MGGRTMPTECVHGVVRHWAGRRCVACDRERIERGNLSTLRWGVSKYPAEAVAQLVADGVLVPSGTCGDCEGAGVICAWGGAAQSTCPACEGSGKAENWYRLVLPEVPDGD